MPMSQKFEEALFPHLPKIINEYGTPFHIYHRQGILDTGTRLKRAFSQTPRFQEFYAVKALPDPAILRLMVEMGFGFDCSSIPELILATEAGAKPKQIIFTSNNTTNTEFEYALNLGCILNLDDSSFLEKPILRQRMPELICFRINPGTRQTGNSIIGKPTEAKYGITWEQIIPTYKKAYDMGARHFGIHTMVASNDLDHEHMLVTIRLLLEAATNLKRELGIQVEFINMGGGIGTPYKPEDPEFRLEALGAEANVMLDAFYGNERFEPSIYMESGRFMTGPHGVLVNRAINCKRIYQTHVGVEVAMPALMRHGMYDTYHHVTVLDYDGKPVTGRKMEHVNIVGPICENCDRLATQISLPQIHIDHVHPELGDLIITHNTGAHGSAMGFNYNGRCRVLGLLLGDDGQVTVTRRAETFDDLLRTTRGL